MDPVKSQQQQHQDDRRSIGTETESSCLLSNGTLTFHCKNQFSQIFQEMNALRQSETLCDVVFVADGRKFLHTVLFWYLLVLTSRPCSQGKWQKVN